MIKVENLTPTNNVSFRAISSKFLISFIRIIHFPLFLLRGITPFLFSYFYYSIYFSLKNKNFSWQAEIFIIKYKLHMRKMLQTVYLIASSKFALDFCLGFFFFKKYPKILKITGKILKKSPKILKIGLKILIKRDKILFFDITLFCSCCKPLSNNS